MGQPIALRPEYDAARLRRLARESKDPDQVRRLLALAVIYEGGSRTEAAEVGGVTLQVVRDWVLSIEGGPLVSLAVATNVLASLTGSASGGLTIALDAGFQSIGPFNRAFKIETGMTPSEFRRVRLAASYGAAAN